jgi:hypothetical protein
MPGDDSSIGGRLHVQAEPMQKSPPFKPFTILSVLQEQVLDTAPPLRDCADRQGASSTDTREGRRNMR